VLSARLRSEHGRRDASSKKGFARRWARSSRSRNGRGAPPLAVAAVRSRCRRRQPSLRRKRLRLRTKRPRPRMKWHRRVCGRRGKRGRRSCRPPELHRPRSSYPASRRRKRKGSSRRAYRRERLSARRPELPTRRRASNPRARVHDRTTLSPRDSSRRRAGAGVMPGAQHCARIGKRKVHRARVPRGATVLTVSSPAADGRNLPVWR
jgi:hypothetical protein